MNLYKIVKIINVLEAEETYFMKTIRIQRNEFKNQKIIDSP